MNVKLFRCLIVTAVAFALIPVFAEMARAPVFKSPFPSNAPKVRVDGHVRGSDDALLTLTVLAPEEVGLTTKAQPVLFWYQSKASRTKFELTISEGKSISPLLEVKFDQLPTDGIQRIRLADHKITLEPGVEYRWTVAMVLDEENRSKDVLASGVIKRVAPADKLQKRLTSAKDDDLPFIYADEGIWYDSLEALSALIDKQPQNKKLYEERAVYFTQVGLHDAAMHEFRLAGVSVTVPAK
jgi:hypothetical protein